MFDGILQKFADRASGAVMVRALLEHLLNAERLDAWFERTSGSQYTRKFDVYDIARSGRARRSCPVAQEQTGIEKAAPSTPPANVQTTGCDIQERGNSWR
ncbi:hypothetical protein G3480_25710 [Thiorhodococcus mannitoliphagus]|uniref:Uncharacterized protein n=1 Tax=Thiorhodococcus mannitoliphagus TaxID=329406 RepID=A0A6P1E2Q4_9GAMM|nr:hypothetical protein [Thiorhodococcus mannitoliphagus]NEX23631.1 hypothetical protein [Thiorhodococcus mannitoliphagus]